MTARYSSELYREEGEGFRAVRLDVHESGLVKLETQDMGKLVEEMWGDSDYEFWVSVPAAELRKLAFALLREKYAGRSSAVDEFRVFCDTHRIEHQWESWT